MNEQKAITLCLKDRDPTGFEYLVKKYRDRALYTAFGWLKNKEESMGSSHGRLSTASNTIPSPKWPSLIVPVEGSTR